MDINLELQKYTFFVETTPVSGSSLPYKFVYKNRTTNYHPENDFVIPIKLTKKYDYYEYVDIKKDNEIIPIQRQEVNPFFVEFSFFDNVKSVYVYKGNQLYSRAIEFIREKRPELANKSESEIREWYEKVGYLQLPWNKGTNFEVTIEDIQKININPETIYGKSVFFDIDINK